MNAGTSVMLAPELGVGELGVGSHVFEHARFMKPKIPIHFESPLAHSPYYHSSCFNLWGFRFAPEAGSNGMTLRGEGEPEMLVVLSPSHVSNT
jgi:hypothetical protein